MVGFYIELRLARAATAIGSRCRMVLRKDRRREKKNREDGFPHASRTCTGTGRFPVMLFEMRGWKGIPS
jgi:hypothetical protein